MIKKKFDLNALVSMLNILSDVKQNNPSIKEVIVIISIGI